MSSLVEFLVFHLLTTLFFFVYLGQASVITGGRLGDFLPPTKSVKLFVSTSESFYQVAHGFDKVPFLVNVYAYSQSEGDNRGYRFDGVGSCQNDGQESEEYGGILFAYNEEFVRIWIPSHFGRDNSGRAIFVGEGWGGNTHSQSSSEAIIVVDMWHNGPIPSFEKHLSFYTKTQSTINLQHPLQMLPEVISVRVTSANRAVGSFYHFHATGSSQTATNTLKDKFRRYGGIIFAYNDKEVVLWGPNKKNGGCIAIGKRWGHAKEADSMFAQNCTIHIRLWVNSFPLPIFQSEWVDMQANQHTKSFIEIKHGLRRYPSLVKVQFRKANNVSEYIFEGTGSVQSTPDMAKKYGGILYAYNKVNIRLWLPTSSKAGQAYVIYVGNGWGDNDYYSESAQVRVLLYMNACKSKNEAVDPLGICRMNSETHIDQKLGNWGKCSNPCGDGTKSRSITECQGRSLQTKFKCDFSKDFCGFIQNGAFGWKRTKGVSGNNRKKLKIPFEGFPPGTYFSYTDTRFAQSYTKGELISPDLSGGGEQCILQFYYNSINYFGSFKVHVLKNDGTWVDEVWEMRDSQVMSGVWRKGYVDLGDLIKGPIRKFKFQQHLEASDLADQQQNNPISLANVQLMCETSDLMVLSKEKCKSKEITSSSCLIDVFKPYIKGPAWRVKTTKNIKKENIGKFVVADGEEGMLIASYKFKILYTTSYAVWIDSFAMSNQTNGITIHINKEGKHSENLIYNKVSSMWLPLSIYYNLDAGTYQIDFIQKEKGCRFRKLMIAPKRIKVWGPLGIQSQLIPDSSFSSLSGSIHYLVFSRLNGEGAWMPTDETKGKFYLQIRLPNLALINKIATQGGTWLNERTFDPCSTDKYKIRFSLDGKHFAYYRNNTLKAEHEFEGNIGVDTRYKIDSINKHTLEYAIVARAVRFYPTEFKWSGCLRVELYGYYISDGICPKIISKEQYTSCQGNQICGSINAACQWDHGLNTSACACIDGFHGEFCNMTGCATNPCKQGASCRMVGGRFNCNCPAGWKGQYCEFKCPVGTYGKDCKQKCACPLKEVCNPVDGSCTCDLGFHGPKCDEKCPKGMYGSGCTQKCSCDSHRECEPKTGHCICKPGYHGENCEMKCLPGFYGVNCSMRCDCQNGGICDTANGKCNCTMGWYGRKCQQKCPEDRWGNGCSNICYHPKNSTCDHKTGVWTCNPGLGGARCDEPCHKGWYGPGCHERCDCNEERTIQCHSHTGKCICKPGYTGEKCDDKCFEEFWGSGCKNKCQCKNDGECDHTTGKCTCSHGFEGDTCDKECPKHKYGKGCTKTCNCTWANTEKCQPSDGRCMCYSGYEGVHCESKCSERNWGKNCRETCRCRYNATCNHKTGYCDCQPGFQGRYCEQRCKNDTWGLNCSKKCSCMNKALCDSVTGGCTCQPGYAGPKCQSACEPGWYGKDCTEKCGCVKERMESCSKTDGTCVCLPGFRGILCEEECVDDTWGKNCEKTCFPCRHSVGPCDKHHGNCSCSTGFVGDKCQQDCPLNRYGENCLRKCTCDKLSLCNNVNGVCYNRTGYVVSLNLKISSTLFNERLYFFKEHFEIMLLTFSQQDLLDDYWNTTDQPFQQKVRERSTIDKESREFIVRIVSKEHLFTSEDEDVTKIWLTVLNGTVPLSASFIRKFIVFLGAKNLSDHYFSGEVFTVKQKQPWYEGHVRWILIGVAALVLLLVFTSLTVKYLHSSKISQPSPFHKIKNSKDAKNNVELQPCLEGTNSHLLAFENPYYDVIAAMGLDDDIEEDYYNPLYEMPSDSETEPEDVYFAYRNNRFDRNHYPYDKDSGFSSGTLM